MFDQAVDLTSFLNGLELSSSNYVSDGAKAFTPDSLDLTYFTTCEFNTVNYVSDGAKAFSQYSVDLTAFLSVGFGASYVANGNKVFTSPSAIEYVSALATVPGDTGQVIVFGLIIDFRANMRRLCVGGVVVFDAFYYGPRIVSYLWSFGDGSFSGDAEPSHQYLIPGLYDVQVLVNTEDGETRIVKKRRYVFVAQNSLVATATPSEGLEPLDVQFMAGLVCNV